MSDDRNPEQHDFGAREPHLNARDEREERRRRSGKLAYKPPKTSGFANVLFILLLIGAAVAWFVYNGGSFQTAGANVERFGAHVQQQASNTLEQVGEGLTEEPAPAGAAERTETSRESAPDEADGPEQAANAAGETATN
jgi:hypothetical protein